MEMRKYPRVPASLPVELVLLAGPASGPEAGPARMANLGVGGVAIRCPGPLAPGALVEVTFRLPGGEDVTARGLVCWSAPEGPHHQAGVQFVELSPRGRELLARHVDQADDDAD